MPRNKPPVKDMYWFAHGGSETEVPPQRTTEEDDIHASNSPSWNLVDRKGSPDEQRGLNVTDGNCLSGPSSLEREDRLRLSDKRQAVEERKKLILEAEQERNDAVLRKHMERDAALEARRNAQRSTISFAFGSSVPRYVESQHGSEGTDNDLMSRSFTVGGLSQKGEDIMSKSMSAAMPSAPRGRRKNDLMPVVFYDRNPAPRANVSSSSRKRSVSMTRLDQLAQPRKHYVEANKAMNGTGSHPSGVKDLKSPSRPLSSASEHSGGSGRPPGASVTRRVRSSPRKPRPVSVAGTLPPTPPDKSYSPLKRASHHAPPPKRAVDADVVRKSAPAPLKASTPKSAEKSRPSARPSTAPKTQAARTPKTPEAKPAAFKQPPPPSKSPAAREKRSTPAKKMPGSPVAPAPQPLEVKPEEADKAPPSEEGEGEADSEKNAKRIISEEEARTALAEKRRLAREQAEKEAELERQRQEQLRLEDEERARQEEEAQRRFEEEQLRLLDEHRRQEEEKLRRAIEDQERREEEEKAKHEEEARLKAEQERKAKEEAERQRLELEEKLRKEEEERAERKKRLEKIMSRTRGKSSGTSPSGSVSGSDQLDSGENAGENFSSGANSLDSNSGSSGGDSMEAHHRTFEAGGGSSENEEASLNSNDLMMTTEVAVEEETPDSPSTPGVEKEEHTTETELDRQGHDDVSPYPKADEKTVVMDFDTPDNADVSRFPEEDQTHIGRTENVDLSRFPDADEKAVATDFDRPDTVDVSPYPKVDEKIVPRDFDRPDTVGVSRFSEEDQAVATSFDRRGNVDVSRFPIRDEETVVADFERPDSDDDASRFPRNPDPMAQSMYGDDQFFGNGEGVDEMGRLGVGDGASSYDRSSSHDESSLPSESFKLPDVPSSMETPPPNFFGADLLKEPAGPRTSVSSDIKLPDPIYETSDEGSISSEKHLTAVDDVFSDHGPAGHQEVGPGVFRSDPFGDLVAQDEPRVGPEGSDAPDTSEFGRPDPFGHAEPDGDKENLPFALPPPFDASDKENVSTRDIIDAYGMAPDDVSGGGDVTFIRSEGACVGIISSLDHDQLSNDFPRLAAAQQPQQFSREFASVTDSENSSLDSVLSQVMADEEEQGGGDNHVGPSSPAVHSNGNPFAAEEKDFGGNLGNLVSYTNHCASGAVSNGHRLDRGDPAPSCEPLVDGSALLSVDRNSIFESVDAISYEKAVPDPFPAKGGPGNNPFLLQDEKQQQQVLVATDFLN